MKACNNPLQWNFTAKDEIKTHERNRGQSVQRRLVTSYDLNRLQPFKHSNVLNKWRVWSQIHTLSDWTCSYTQSGVCTCDVSKRVRQTRLGVLFSYVHDELHLSEKLLTKWIKLHSFYSVIIPPLRNTIKPTLSKQILSEETLEYKYKKLNENNGGQFNTGTPSPSA
jgi:hypothetical protein